MIERKTNPLISVIVPVYKVEPYLKRCIDSILNQSFSDFELILVDDGSPDHCGEICDRYAEKDKRVVVIHKENGRLAAARNTGMDVASGEWLAFVDSDDWVHKDYLKLLISGALADTDVVVCDCFVTDKTNVIDAYLNESIFKSVTINEIYKKQVARTRAWGKLYRKHTIGSLRYIPGTEPAEDFCFNELLFKDDMKFRITDAKLYYYYMRPDSAVHSHNGRGTLNGVRPLLHNLVNIDNKSRRERIISRCYKFVLSARYGEMYSDDYTEIKKKCKILFTELSPFLHELGIKERLIISALAKSPMLYRLWRIVDDPSLIQYEKNQKKLKRERNNV